MDESRLFHMVSSNRRRDKEHKLEYSCQPIFHHSIQWYWSTGEVPTDCRFDNGMLIYSTGRKEDLENDKPVSLNLVSGKVMEQIFSVIVQNVWDNQGVSSSQYGFMKSRSCMNNLTSFHDQVTCLVDERKGSGYYLPKIYLSFFNVSPSILLEKLAAHGFDTCTLWWVKNWMDCMVKRVHNYMYKNASKILWNSCI